ncbi:MAG: hypothetical protein QY326_01685 [Bdellovibrionota bacterium]|nr:MAG: hypothetical protein QY326_01685 [Bdellovibrionota bacterium]
MQEDPEEKIPRAQKYYDNPWLLLVAGLAVMFVFYTLWGLAEIYSLPPAPLP